MKKVLVLLMLALLPLGAFAQKDTRETQSQITYDIPVNGLHGDIQQNIDRAKVDELVAQIRDAKNMGDVQKSIRLQDELDKISGNVAVKSTINNNGPQVISEVVNEPVAESDYNLTILNGSDANWSVATSTDRVTGRIYVVSTKYVTGAGSDSAKIFTSSNNGISWVLVTRLAFAADVQFSNDEIDIEAVNSGTMSYVFGVVGLIYNGLNYSLTFRYNSLGGEFYYSYLYTTAAGNNFINARITSDNSKYTGAAYVYFILTQDSSLAGGLHRLRTKYSVILDPFAVTPTMTYRNLSSNAYFWIATSVADSTKMYNDIAYSDSANADHIITVTNYYKYTVTNLYMTYSRDYGATTPTYVPAIVDANLNYKPRLSCTGLTVGGSQYLALTYVRRFNATDWDPYYQRTTNNGTTWTGGYVDASTDTTVYSDVIAVARIPNTFRFAYSTMSNNSDGKAFVRAFNGVLIGTRLQLNPAPSSVNYTPVRAGYRLAATDSCFTVVQGYPSSVGIYGYSGCTGALTGIGNTESPLSFKLSQNYPNPFNPVTKIAYALPKSGLVTLRVYDILGKEVATLVNEVKNAGNYSVDFSASNFTSGVYFYKIETNGFSDIKKMMLIK